MVNEWTRDDLPTEDESAETYMAKGVYSVHEGIALVLDAVVDHLNAHHPKPVPGMLWATKTDVDRWRRAHEIVEGERDQARRERDMWKEKCLDTYEALHDARAERDEAVARAEAAEARTAPAVTKADIEKVVRGQWGGCFDGLTDAVWSLVSGADPAVHVVRESNVAAVEVRRASDGWYADGAWLASADETAEWVRDRATEMVVCAARNEAVARAIEAGQAADPLLGKAQEFAALADWELTDREAELLHTVARHVLGQEAK